MMVESTLWRGDRYAVRAPLQNTGTEMYLSGDPSSPILIRDSHSCRYFTMVATTVGEEEHWVMSGRIARSRAMTSLQMGVSAMCGIA